MKRLTNDISSCVENFNLVDRDFILRVTSDGLVYGVCVHSLSAEVEIGDYYLPLFDYQPFMHIGFFDRKAAIVFKTSELDSKYQLIVDAAINKLMIATNNSSTVDFIDRWQGENSLHGSWLWHNIFVGQCLLGNYQAGLEIVRSKRLHDFKHPLGVDGRLISDSLFVAAAKKDELKFNLYSAEMKRRNVDRLGLGCLG